MMMKPKAESNGMELSFRTPDVEQRETGVGEESAVAPRLDDPWEKQIPLPLCGIGMTILKS